MARISLYFLDPDRARDVLMTAIDNAVMEPRTVTELVMAALAESLSPTSPALLTLDVGNSTDQQGLRGSITLADAGRAASSTSNQLL